MTNNKPVYSNFDFQGVHTAKNLPLPVAGGDAASKEYVDLQAGGSPDIVSQNAQVISEDGGIQSGFNGYSIGPVTIAEGVTFTIPENSIWMVVP